MVIDIMAPRTGSTMFVVTDTVCKITRMVVVVVGNKISKSNTKVL